MDVGEYMKKIAEFKKVSFEIYKEELIKNLDITQDACKIYYDNIELPKRATTGSAGYDFKLPFSITLKPGETKKIPTGIRVNMADGWVLVLVPRSSLGFKYRMQLDNTLGIIDSDYYYSDNEGHIILKVTNDSKENKEMFVEASKGICQGLFLEFGITIDDDAKATRNGGFGSTN